VDRGALKRLLDEVRSGSLSVGKALEQLRKLPFQDMGFAKIDTHRHLRKGFPEVVLGQEKTARQIIEIVKQVRKNGNNLLITRVDAGKAASVLRVHPDLRRHAASRTLYLHLKEIEDKGRGTILVVTAGTSDIPVAEEAAVTAEVMGNEVERIYDVGVAGLHRLLARRKDLDRAVAIVVAAGMEGALPSVVGGLVGKPVIGLPTSVGYGASLGGLAPLFTMLNSCAPNVTVVNVDNGFGAGLVAGLIARR
jgi:NCAIR mutase (PurE)-related protein